MVYRLHSHSLARSEELGGSEGRHAMQHYGGTMQQVARRPEILSHRFASFDWREREEGGEEGGMKNAD